MLIGDSTENNELQTKLLSELRAKAQSNQQNKAEAERVCVVGAGLVGLSAIAEAIHKAKLTGSKKKIIFDLIDVRKDFAARRQKIINRDAVDLQSNPKATEFPDTISWVNFMQNLFNHDNRYTILKDTTDKVSTFQLCMNGVPCQKEKMNARERLLLRIMRDIRPEERKQINFSIKSVQLALYEYIQDEAKSLSNISVNTHFGDKITDMIENENKKFELSLNNGDEKLQFDTMFICEGTSRNTVLLVNKQLKNDGFEFANMEVSPRQDYHATARVMFKPLSEIEGGKFKSYRELFDAFKNKSQNSNQGEEEEYKQVLIKYRWNAEKTKSPNINRNINFTPDILGKQPVFGISCDIPKHIFEMKDQNEKNAALKEWVLQLIADAYNMPIKYFDFDNSGEKEKFLNTTTFLLDEKFEYMLDPVIAHSNQHYVALGDAARTPFFYSGSGAQTGMNAARLASDLLLMEGKNTENKFMLLMKKHMLYTRAQQMYLDLRFDKKGKTENELSVELSDLLRNHTSANHEETLSRIRTLLNKGVNPDKSEIKKLAAETSNLEIVSELLVAGMKIVKEDFKNYPYYENNKEVSELVHENDFSTKLYFLLNRLDIMFNIKELSSFNERQKSLAELYEMVSIVMRELSVVPVDYFKLNDYIDAIDNKLDIIHSLDRKILTRKDPSHFQLLDRYYGQINYSSGEAQRANDNFKYGFDLIVNIKKNGIETCCHKAISKIEAFQNILNNLASAQLFTEYNNQLLAIPNKIKAIKVGDVVGTRGLLDIVDEMQKILSNFEKSLQNGNMSQADKYAGNKILNMAAYMLDFEAVGDLRKALNRINLYEERINKFIGSLKNDQVFTGLAYVAVKWDSSANKFHITSDDNYDSNRQDIFLTYDELINAIKKFQAKYLPEISNEVKKPESHLLSNSLGSVISASHTSPSPSPSPQAQNEQNTRESGQKQNYKS